MPRYSLRVNGKLHSVVAGPETPMLWILRDELRLTGTKYGCGVGVCGACTVHENGTAVRSCQVAVGTAANKSYTTIEGLSVTSSHGNHPCQMAWVEEDVAQCGFCQPGMIMEAAALLARNITPSDPEIDQVMAQHVCRCGTYQRMRRAIHRVSDFVPEKKAR